jgi:hypothetical protein
MGRSGWPGVIGWQLEGFEACELGDPVVVELLEVITAEALALPGGVVLVVDFEGLELRRLAAAVGVVERGEIAGEDGARPTIGGDVMVVDQEDMLISGDLEQACTQQQA